jgi:twitching motility protein PilU
LSLNLRGIVSQRLVPAAGGGRAAALEVLLDTPRIKDLIRRGETDGLKDAMDQSVVEGCQTFDSALAALFVAGRVAGDEALRAADSPNNLRLRLERVQRRGGGKPAQTMAGNRLRLANDPPVER